MQFVARHGVVGIDTLCSFYPVGGPQSLLGVAVSHIYRLKGFQCVCLLGTELHYVFQHIGCLAALPSLEEQGGVA